VTGIETTVRQNPQEAEAAKAVAEVKAVRAVAEVEAVAELRAAESANYARAVLNILEDAGEDQARRSDSQRATINILEDLDTERVRLVSTQRALMNMLDDLEVERRNVDKSNLELREVNDAMRSFIATAAHDLRSPLASMVGFSSLLKDSWTSLSDDRRLKFVTTIDRQSHKLTSLVNDLLTLSSVEGGVLSTRPELIGVSEAVNQSLAAISHDTAGVTVSCSPDLTVRCDRSHLGRILENYLENAFKYGQAPVRVEASPLGDLVEIRVVDHGTGVPTEFENKLFGKFARADEPSMRDQKGTGLGLSIVRGLAQANGGLAEYERNVPQGSCFIVLLPKDDGAAG